MARLGIEPRTSDLRVRYPTDCATRLGTSNGNELADNLAKEAAIEAITLKDIWTVLTKQHSHLPSAEGFLPLKFDLYP